MGWSHEPPLCDDDARVHKGYAVLHELLDGYLREHPEDRYLGTHCQTEWLLNQARIVRWYVPHVPAHGKVLDWGCRYAPDSVILRVARGDGLELHGSDFGECAAYRRFHEAARLQFQVLTDNLVLPYADDTFDTVIGAGTLEHTAMDYESLKQVYRVLKPVGLFIFSHLPYVHSRDERINSEVRKEGFHNRLYDRGETEWLLKHTGFLPLELRFQEALLLDEIQNRLLPQLPSAYRRWRRRLKWWFLRTFTPRNANSVLCGIAKKVYVM